MTIGNAIDTTIMKAVINFDDTYHLENPFEALIGMGELVDRLSVVNFKLFTLKNRVMASTDPVFKAWAAEEDVKLVMERSRLKHCIDLKLCEEIRKVMHNQNHAPLGETKLYGQGGS